MLPQHDVNTLAQKETSVQAGTLKANLTQKRRLASEKEPQNTTALSIKSYSHNTTSVDAFRT